MVGKLYETTPRAGAPLVTVAVRAFNSRRFIRAALDGAVAQTYRPLEIVVCDDGSTDGTDAIIHGYLADVSTDIPILFIRHSVNAGVGAALDTIIANSHGEYVMIADSDDVSLPGRAAECVDAIRRRGKEYLGVACRGQCIDAAGNKLDGQILLHQDQDLTPQAIVRGGGLKGGMSLLARRVFQAGPPLCGLRQQEDRLLGYRAACLGKLECVPKVLMLRRVHMDNTSGYLHQSHSTAEARLRVSRNAISKIRSVARMLQETDYLLGEGLLGSAAADDLALSLRRELRILRLYRVATHRRRPLRITAVLALLRQRASPRTVGQICVHANLPWIAAVFLWRHSSYRLTRKSITRCFDLTPDASRRGRSGEPIEGDRDT
jgi:glycosyltransferase involved in cell wall biosynthesis